MLYESLINEQNKKIKKNIIDKINFLTEQSLIASSHIQIPDTSDELVNIDIKIEYTKDNLDYFKFLDKNLKSFPASYLHFSHNLIDDSGVVNISCNRINIYAEHFVEGLYEILTSYDPKNTDQTPVSQ